MADVDAVVIGAGAVGLAIARALALAGLETLILDRDARFGAGTSSRNSEVIHAGLYYPPGSRKASACIAGRALLYDFCAARGVPHKRCGKLIVAVDEAQIGALDALAANAEASGAGTLERLDARDLARLEPALRGVAGLLSPQTGIVDSHAFMTALLGEAESHGAMFVGRAHVTRIARTRAGWAVYLEGDDTPTVVACWIVNAAGLGAHDVAAAFDDADAASIPRQYLAKGSYYTYAGAVPFGRLIYPLPEPGGLGVHLTLDLGGRARFGPDVEWVDRCDSPGDYAVDPAKRDGFAAAIGHWWPGVDASRLAPDYAGMRPKLSGPGEAAADFVIQGVEAHGLPQVIQLLGIESPGLTAAMAIAEDVAASIAVGQPIEQQAAA